MIRGSTTTLLRAVEEPDLPTALAAALDGGPPVAPLPPAPVERARALRALRLDEPADPGAAVVVLSSGSTGDPKAVVLSADADPGGGRGDPRPARRAGSLAAAPAPPLRRRA